MINQPNLLALFQNMKLTILAFAAFLQLTSCWPVQVQYDMTCWCDWYWHGMVQWTTLSYTIVREDFKTFSHGKCP